jgi:hypothetical protein
MWLREACSMIFKVVVRVASKLPIPVAPSYLSFYSLITIPSGNYGFVTLIDLEENGELQSPNNGKSIYVLVDLP